MKVYESGYTTGFYLGEHDKNGYSYDISKGLAGADFLCEFMNTKDGEHYLVKIKNKITLNDDVEIISPNEQFITKVLDIKNQKGEVVDVANTNDEIWIRFEAPIKDYKYAIARTIGIRNPREEKKCC